MKRLYRVMWIAAVLLGITIVLPAVANYGLPGPMGNDALKHVLAGAIVILAGLAGVCYGLRKRQA